MQSILLASNPFEHQRLYLWTAMDNQQQLIKGESLAKSRQQLYYQLLSQQRILLRVNKTIGLSKSHWSHRHLILLIQQLALLLHAGLPLVNSLQLLSSQQTKPQWRYLLKRIIEQLAQGTPFSQVLDCYPTVFPHLFRQLIYTAEVTGELALCCTKMAQQQEQELKQKNAIKKALRYPLFVLVVATVITSLMLIWLIPQFEQIYQTFNVPLPYLTQKLIHFADFIRTKTTMIILLFFLFIIIRKKFYRHPKWLAKEQHVLLSLPIIKSMINAYCLSSIFYVLAMTQRSGIVLVDGLTIAAQSIDYQRYQQALHNIKNRLEQGQSFSQSLIEQPLIPTLAKQLIQIGEESGVLELTLTRLATLYQQELENASDKIIQLLEPILMLVLSLIVGSIVIAIYLPLFQLGDVIGGV